LQENMAIHARVTCIRRSSDVGHLSAFCAELDHTYQRFHWSIGAAQEHHVTHRVSFYVVAPTGKRHTLYWARDPSGAPYATAGPDVDLYSVLGACPPDRDRLHSPRMDDEHLAAVEKALVRVTR
jgi:hypothetical protein